MKRIATYVLLFVLTGLSACKGNDPELIQYSDVFDEIWDCLDNNYVFFDKMSCNWDSLYTSSSRKMETVATNEAFSEEMRGMLTSIGDPMIKVSYNNRGSFCPNVYYAQDAANRLFEQSQKTYRILGGSNNIGNVICAFGRIVRTDSLNTDSVTGIYDAICINEEEITDDFGNYAALFRQYIQTYDNDGRAKGLILDLRSCAWMDMDFMTTILESLYPKNTTHQLTLKNRVPGPTKHNSFVTAKVISIQGKGYYQDKPVVILINRATIMTPHVLATVLAGCPNVAVIGREADSGQGGVLKYHQLDTPNKTTDYIAYPGCILSDGKHETFNAPLKPDIYVEWTPDYSMGRAYAYDKVLDAALDYIDLCQ